MRSFKGTIYSHMRRIKKKRIRLLLNVLSQKIKDHMAHKAHSNGLAALKNTTTSMKKTRTILIPPQVKRRRAAPASSSSIAKVDSARFLIL